MISDIPLVTPERAEILRQFWNDLRALQARYQVTIHPERDFSGDFYIRDQTRVLPSGYHADAYIHGDGEIEIADWVEEEEPAGGSGREQ